MYQQHPVWGPSNQQPQMQPQMQRPSGLTPLHYFVFVVCGLGLYGVVAGSSTVTGVLLTMLATRWGDRNIAFKSLLIIDPVINYRNAFDTL